MTKPGNEESDVLESSNDRELARPNRRRLFLLVVKGLVSVSLIAFVFSNVDFTLAWQKIEKLSVALMATVFVVLFGQNLIAAMRWYVILRQQQINIPLTTTVKFSFIGAFFNQLLPSSIGGDVARAWYVYHHGQTKGAAIISVLTDRIYGMIVLVFLAGLAYPFSFGWINSAHFLAGAGLALAAAFVALALMFLFDKLPPTLRRWKITSGLAALSLAARRLGRDTASLGNVVALSSAIHGCTILALLIMIRGLEPHVDLWLSALLIPIVALVTMVPISIAGWGVREGAMVYCLGVAGVPPETALVVSILFGLALSAVGALGGLVWVNNSRQAMAVKATEISSR